MMVTQKNFPNDIYRKNIITNEDNTIRVRSTSVILFIFMSNIVSFVYNNNGCFLFNILQAKSV